MKKFVSLLMCCVFAVAAFAVFPQAKRAITVEEAKELIIKMTDFENAVVGGSSVLETGYVLDDLPSTPVTDVELQKRVKAKMNLPLHEDIEIRRFDGEYGKASYWNEYFRTFFTDKYVDEELKIPRPITQLDGAVYTVDTALYISTPGFPSLIAEKPIEECITLVDEDTVLFEAVYESYDGEKYEIDFEYTENGWRISGGGATEKWMSNIIRYGTNPDTSDNVIVIVVCATAALLGIALTANKKRFAR